MPCSARTTCCARPRGSSCGARSIPRRLQARKKPGAGGDLLFGWIFEWKIRMKWMILGVSQTGVVGTVFSDADMVVEWRYGLWEMVVIKPRYPTRFRAMRLMTYDSHLLVGPLNKLTRQWKSPNLPMIFIFKLELLNLPIASHCYETAQIGSCPSSGWLVSILIYWHIHIHCEVPTSCFAGNHLLSKSKTCAIVNLWQDLANEAAFVKGSSSHTRTHLNMLSMLLILNRFHKNRTHSPLPLWDFGIPQIANPFRFPHAVVASHRGGEPRRRGSMTPSIWCLKEQMVLKQIEKGRDPRRDTDFWKVHVHLLCPMVKRERFGAIRVSIFPTSSFMVNSPWTPQRNPIQIPLKSH